MKRTGLFVFVVLMVLAMMISCSRKKEEVASGTTIGEQVKALEKITISVHPSGHGLPSYIADKFGYYKDEGLDVNTLVYIGAPPQMEAYSTGAWSIGTTGFGGIILGAAKNDLVVTGVAIDDGLVMGLWARPGSDFDKAGYNPYELMVMPFGKTKILLTQGDYECHADATLKNVN